MKSYKPAYIFGKLPRSVELIIWLIGYNILVFVLLYSNFFTIIDYRKQYPPFTSVMIYLVLSVGFFIMKFYRTKTIVNSLAFDSEKQTLTIEYSLYYFFSRKVIIKYKDLFFEFYDGSGFEHPYLVANIFDKKNKVVKFVSRNGWNKKIFNEIITELQQINPTEKSANKYF